MEHESAVVGHIEELEATNRFLAALTTADSFMKSGSRHPMWQGDGMEISIPSKAPQNVALLILRDYPGLTAGEFVAADRESADDLIGIGVAREATEDDEKAYRAQRENKSLTHRAEVRNKAG